MKKAKVAGGRRGKARKPGHEIEDTDDLMDFLPTDEEVLARGGAAGYDPIRAFEAEVAAELKAKLEARGGGKKAPPKKKALTVFDDVSAGAHRSQRLVIRKIFCLYPEDVRRLKVLCCYKPGLESVVIRSLIRKARPYSDLDLRIARSEDQITHDITGLGGLLSVGDTGRESQGGGD